MQRSGLSRRKVLAGGVAAPALIGAGVLLHPTPARADAPMMGAGSAPFSRFRLGAFEVTTLLAGTRTVGSPQEIFGLNATPEEFAAASAEAFIPADKAQFFFTPTLVNTGSELILFDAGMQPDGINAALAAAGYSADQVDVVVLTHMHPDHIGGLAAEGTPTFPNARYVAGAIEHNHWMAAGNELFDANVRPLADRTTMLDDGGAVAPGITAMAAFGHTPGHMVFRIESDGQSLLVTADTANHFAWSLARPDWEVRFDADKAAAAATRRAVFGMLASERIPFIGYHMPFPALGYVEAVGDGFRYVPASYQLIMGEPA